MSQKLLDSIEITSIVAAGEGAQHDSSVELLQVFSINGELLGLAPRLLCHRLGLLHKAVFCFFVNHEGHHLLQTRMGGRLDVAVGGHLCSTDDSNESGMIREILEEMGLELDAIRLSKIAEYTRRSDDRLSKPREVNNELRIVYLFEPSQIECDTLHSKFLQREEKKSIIDMKWFDLKDVVAACDSGNAADGLSASILHYLLWIEQHDFPSHIKCTTK